MSKKYKVWTCKIAIPCECELPPGFDSPPRQAAEQAIVSAGFPVLMNSSGWGGLLTDEEIGHLENVEKRGREDVYVAGAMCASDETAH